MFNLCKLIAKYRIFFYKFFRPLKPTLIILISIWLTLVNNSFAEEKTANLSGSSPNTTSTPNNSSKNSKKLEPEILKVPKAFLHNPDKGDENSSLIAQINLGKLYILESAALCYKERNKIFVSFSQFTKAVEFPITINDDLSGANGWFIEEKRLFTLNFNSELLLVYGNRFAFSPENIRVIDNEIYFELGLLQKIFPLKLSFDPYEQVIEVLSLEPLPAEKEMARNRKWEDMRNQQETEKRDNDESKISLIKSPYKAISSPVVDLRMTKNFTTAKNANNQPFNINGLAGGDLLFLNHQLFFSANHSKIDTARLTSGQKDSQGELLGPLKATEFQIGDITSQQNFLVSRGGQIGKGVSVTNYPEEYVSGFDQILVRGNMQAGWDVELYRNDQLLLFQKVSSAGIYEFENVPLVAGSNIIKLLFFGPFGQKREEVRKYFVNESLLKSGKFYYRLQASKNNDTLISTDNQNSQIKDPRDNKNRYFTEFAYGINKTTSLITNFIKIPIDIDGKSKSYNSSSLRSSILGIYMDFNIARQIETRTNAFQTSAQTKIFEQSLTLKNIRYDKKFVSEQQQESADPLFDSSTIRVDGPIGNPSNGLLNSFNLTYNRFFSHQNRLDLQNDIAANITSKFSIGQNLRYISDSRLYGPDSIIKNGRTILNYRISRPLTLRSTISYDIKPTKALSSTSTSLDYSLSNSAMLNFAHNYHFPQAGKSGATNYMASFSKPFKKILFSASSTYNDDDGSYGLNLNLSMSIGYDLRHKTGLLSSIPMANNGIISAKIFVDTNNNGKFDGKDYGLENVRIMVDGKPSQAKSDKNGVIMMGQVPTANPVKLKVAIEDIADPALIVKKPAFKIIVHAGSITNIDFPVVSTGEISGMVSVSHGKEINYASSVQIELLDEDNNLVKETVSAFDGYYIFDSVPLGDYKIRVSPSQMARLNMKTNLTNQTVAITAPEQEVKLDFSVIVGGTSEELAKAKEERSDVLMMGNNSAENSKETTIQNTQPSRVELIEKAIAEAIKNAPKNGDKLAILESQNQKKSATSNASRSRKERLSKNTTNSKAKKNKDKEAVKKSSKKSKKLLKSISKSKGKKLGKITKKKNYKKLNKASKKKKIR